MVGKMEPVDTHRFDTIATLVGDTPFSVTPRFFLQRRACDVYADSVERPRCALIVPHTPAPEAHLFLGKALTPAEIEHLADFLAQMDSASSFMVPVELVQPLRARRPIQLEVEGLCFTYRRIPKAFRVLRPELVRQLTATDAALVSALPEAAEFVYGNYGSPLSLLTEGLAFGVVQKGRLASISASLALTPQYCDVGVYTLPRYRNRGYATDCVEAIFAHVLAQGRRPLWRIGVRQKVAIYFAEKLAMEEIGVNGQEVYLHTAAPD
jgi:GNAT superfamily N-acetyltransferase